MSAEAQPISTSAFAAALRDLPAENLYSKAVEIRNSVAHLERSNAQLQEYSDSIANDTSIPEDIRCQGDADCFEAIRENMVVIDRQKTRITLLKAEIERRGGRWHDVGEPMESEDGQMNGQANGEGDGENDEDEATPDLTRASTMDTMASRGGGTTGAGEGGRLTDEELRRQLAERMGQDDDEDGMHL